MRKISLVVILPILPILLLLVENVAAASYSGVVSVDAIYDLPSALHVRKKDGTWIYTTGTIHISGHIHGSGGVTQDFHFSGNIDEHVSTVTFVFGGGLGYEEGTVHVSGSTQGIYAPSNGTSPGIDDGCGGSVDFLNENAETGDWSAHSDPSVPCYVTVDWTRSEFYADGALLFDAPYLKTENDQPIPMTAHVQGTFGIAVGGVLIPVDKLALLAPYIILAVATVAISVSVLYAKKGWFRKIGIRRS